MTAWSRGTLGEVARWGSGGTPSTKDPSLYGGSIPWVVIGDLPDGPVQQTAATLTEAGLAKSSAKLIPPDAVLVAMYGASIGRLGITTREVTTNQAIAHAVPHDGLDAKYLFYYLMSEKERLVRSGKGAAQPNIGQGVLKAWPISYPKAVSDQRVIVAILEDHLSHLDAAASSTDFATRRLAGLREQAITDAITGGSAEKRVPADLKSVGTHDGHLPALPEGWDWARLGEVADVVGGVTKDAKKQADPAFVEVPYLRVANVQRGHLRLDNVTSIRVSPEKAKVLELYAGDVLLNEGGDRDKLARGWVWEGQIDRCIHQNHVFRARIHEPRLDPYFLSWTANTLGGRWAERNGKQSVNLASISLRLIRRMPVIVPPAGAALQIVEGLQDQLESIDRLRAAADAAQHRAATLRRALLAAAFSGRLTSTASEASISEELEDV